MAFCEFLNQVGNGGLEIYLRTAWRKRLGGGEDLVRREFLSGTANEKRLFMLQKSTNKEGTDSNEGCVSLVLCLM